MTSRTASAVPSGLPSSATHTSIVSALGEELQHQRADVLPLVVGRDDDEDALGHAQASRKVRSVSR